VKSVATVCFDINFDVTLMAIDFRRIMKHTTMAFQGLNCQCETFAENFYPINLFPGCEIVHGYDDVILLENLSNMSLYSVPRI